MSEQSFNVLKRIAAAVEDQSEALGASVARSVALEASRVVSASPAKLLGFLAHNNGSSDQYIQVFDAAAVPADGAVPVLTMLAPAGRSVTFDSGEAAMPFAAGIVVCNSSTGAAKTIGAANCLFTFLWRAA